LENARDREYHNHCSELDRTWLARQPKAAQGPQPSANAPPVVQRKILANILIVDDDIAVQAVMRLLLERDGHDVVAAGDGLKGLEIFTTRNFDLLIVDIFMPGMDGLETMRNIRRQRPDIPIIVISGRPIPSDFGAGPEFFTITTKLGAIRSLQKPFKAPTLRTMVAECLEGAGTQSSAVVGSAGGVALDP
jgi:CheY-like chemotaxis protein